MKIGMQFAMPAELHALPGARDLEPFEIVSGVPLYRVAEDIIACAGGIGKVNAAMSAEVLCLHCGVDMIVNAGVAGCATDLPTGSLVVPSEFLQHDMDTTIIGDKPGELFLPGESIVSIPCDGDMVSALEKACDSSGKTDHITGTIATGDQFIGGNERRLSLNERFGALACEMEGAAIGHVCVCCGVPYVILRAISDKADDSATVDYDTFEKMAIRHCVNLVRGMVAAMAEV